MMYNQGENMSMWNKISGAFTSGYNNTIGEMNTTDKVVCGGGIVVGAIGVTLMSVYPAGVVPVVGGTMTTVATVSTMVVVGKVLLVVGSGMVVGSVVSGFVRGMHANIRHTQKQIEINNQ